MMKEEEVRKLKETRVGDSTDSEANHSFSTIHDISLDEKAIEAQHCLLTTGKMKGCVLSASSTPTRPALGSIAEELLNLQELTEKECLPSPFCEKKERQVSAALDRMSDNIRAAIRAKTETRNRKELMAAVGGE